MSEIRVARQILMISSDPSSKIVFQIDVGVACQMRGHEEKHSPTIKLFFSSGNLWIRQRIICDWLDQEIFETSFAINYFPRNILVLQQQIEQMSTNAVMWSIWTLQRRKGPKYCNRDSKSSYEFWSRTVNETTRWYKDNDQMCRKGRMIFRSGSGKEVMVFIVGTQNGSHSVFGKLLWSPSFFSSDSFFIVRLPFWSALNF